MLSSYFAQPHQQEMLNERCINFLMLQDWPTPPIDQLIPRTRCLSVRDMGFDTAARNYMDGQKNDMGGQKGSIRDEINRKYCDIGLNRLRYHVNWFDNDADASPHIAAGQLKAGHHMERKKMEFQKLKACHSNCHFNQNFFASWGLTKLSCISEFKKTRIMFPLIHPQKLIGGLF